MEDKNPSPIQDGETPPQTQEPAGASEQGPPPEEPIVLNKLYPDAERDLDALFPDPQMKKLLKEVHRTQQSNQRFLKRLNLSNMETEGDGGEESGKGVG